MKPYLVDVPVFITLWTRPECQRRQFEVLKQARPSILFLVSDGGRNEDEWEKIRENRTLFDSEIDWDCTVYRIYSDKNLGLYAMTQKGKTFVWETVDRCIFLEDDVIPSVSFFAFCAELLERYKNDLRVCAICGMNYLECYEEPSSDYFFTTGGCIWGAATWRRTHELTNDFSYGKDPYTMRLLQENDPKEFPLWAGYAQDPLYDGHPAGYEFYFDFDLTAQHQLFIVPKYNQISNVGATADAAHASDLEKLPRKLRGVFNLKTYELEFPLKHPKYVIPDIKYRKTRDRIMGFGHPILRFFRHGEAFWYHLLAGDFKHIYRRLADILKGTIHYET